jgi:zinc D-Ala-D-Ala carboxypeptidase
MTSLSAHFTLEEATLSQTASRLGIDNDPTLDVVLNMKQAALGMELVRQLLGQPIHINSWFRCPELNKAVGSKPTSDHITGFAVDFTCPTFGTPEAIVREILKSNIDFKQVIYEFDSWVHIAFNGMQRQALVIDQSGTRVFA